MKKSIFALVVLILGFGFILSAQSFPNPKFSLRPYIVESDSVLKTFERADAHLDIKVKGLGYGGSETYYTAFKPNSDVRFSKNALPKIIIKIDGNIDPSDQISLSKAIVKKDRRRFLQASMALGGKSRDVSSYYVNLEFKIIRDGIYELILPSDIQTGEYAFMPPVYDGGNYFKSKIYCFGID